jgi:hypothetical protein
MSIILILSQARRSRNAEQIARSNRPRDVGLESISFTSTAGNGTTSGRSIDEGRLKVDAEGRHSAGRGELSVQLNLQLHSIRFPGARARARLLPVCGSTRRPVPIS